jgi:hypothetical protein
VTWGEGLVVTIELAVALLIYILKSLGLLPEHKPHPPPPPEPDGQVPGT